MASLALLATVVWRSSLPEEAPRAGDDRRLGHELVERANELTVGLTGIERLHAYARETSLDLVLVATQRALVDQRTGDDRSRRDGCRLGLRDYHQFRSDIAVVAEHVPDPQLGETILAVLDDVAVAWRRCVATGSAPDESLDDRLAVLIEASVDVEDTLSRMVVEAPPVDGARPPGGADHS